MPGFDYYFNGFIDDVRIYNKGLSESEIEELYEGILIPINCTDNDLDGYSIEGGECGLVDCDDSNENINPGVEEICNGIDDNCVLGIDEGGNSLCSDNLFCNGAEVCMSSLGCLNGIPIDCSFNNLESFSVCDYSPDNNSFTLDFFAGFNSVCNEDTDSCTNSIIEVSHNCSLNCGAECEFDLDCDDENNLTLDICNGCFCEHSFLSICGNNFTDYNETCDGNLQSCLTSEGYFGYQECNLECNGWQECIAIESCGDGIINGNEICDNNNLSEENCETQGFDEGSLGCLSDCSGYNISECVIDQTPQELIWDNFEESSARRNQIVTFYANYNDGENPIDGADCLITFDDGNWEMADAGSYYEFYRTFPEEGLESWSVNCQATGYNNLQDVNNITITDYPSNVLVIDHRAIDEFDELLNDNEAIESAKKLVGQSVGQSHSTQVIYGLELLNQQDSRLSIDIYGDEPTENNLNGMSDYNGELRITNKQFNTDFSSAGSYIGEEDYWAFEDARLMTEFTTNNFNPEFNFSL
ncbi:MAG: MopE-related protein, partial [Nanoarchaeota archaeon]